MYLKILIYMIASINTKYLGLNLTKDVQKLYTKTQKTLQWEIKANKVERGTMFMD